MFSGNGGGPNRHRNQSGNRKDDSIRDFADLDNLFEEEEQQQMQQKTPQQASQQAALPSTPPQQIPAAVASPQQMPHPATILQQHIDLPQPSTSQQQIQSAALTDSHLHHGGLQQGNGLHHAHPQQQRVVNMQQSGNNIQPRQAVHVVYQQQQQQRRVVQQQPTKMRQKQSALQEQLNRPPSLVLPPLLMYQQHGQQHQQQHPQQHPQQHAQQLQRLRQVPQQMPSSSGMQRTLSGGNLQQQPRPSSRVHMTNQQIAYHNSPVKQQQFRVVSTSQQAHQSPQHIQYQAQPNPAIPGGALPTITYAYEHNSPQYPTNSPAPSYQLVQSPQSIPQSPQNNFINQQQSLNNQSMNSPLHQSGSMGAMNGNWSDGYKINYRVVKDSPQHQPQHMHQVPSTSSRHVPVDYTMFGAQNHPQQQRIHLMGSPVPTATTQNLLNDQQQPPQPGAPNYYVEEHTVPLQHTPDNQFHPTSQTASPQVDNSWSEGPSSHSVDVHDMEHIKDFFPDLAPLNASSVPAVQPIDQEEVTVRNEPTVGVPTSRVNTPLEPVQPFTPVGVADPTSSTDIDSIQLDQLVQVYNGQEVYKSLGGDWERAGVPPVVEEAVQEPAGIETEETVAEPEETIAVSPVMEDLCENVDLSEFNIDDLLFTLDNEENRNGPAENGANSSSSELHSLRENSLTTAGRNMNVSVNEGEPSSSEAHPTVPPIAKKGRPGARIRIPTKDNPTGMPIRRKKEIETSLFFKDIEKLSNDNLDKYDRVKSRRAGTTTIVDADSDSGNESNTQAKDKSEKSKKLVQRTPSTNSLRPISVEADPYLFTTESPEAVPAKEAKKTPKTTHNETPSTSRNKDEEREERRRELKKLQEIANGPAEKTKTQKEKEKKEKKKVEVKPVLEHAVPLFHKHKKHREVQEEQEKVAPLKLKINLGAQESEKTNSKKAQMPVPETSSTTGKGKKSEKKQPPSKPSSSRSSRKPENRYENAIEDVLRAMHERKEAARKASKSNVDTASNSQVDRTDRDSSATPSFREPSVDTHRSVSRASSVATQESKTDERTKESTTSSNGHPGRSVSVESGTQRDMRRFSRERSTESTSSRHSNTTRTTPAPSSRPTSVAPTTSSSRGSSVAPPAVKATPPPPPITPREGQVLAMMQDDDGEDDDEDLLMMNMMRPKLTGFRQANQQQPEQQNASFPPLSRSTPLTPGPSSSCRNTDSPNRVPRPGSTMPPITSVSTMPTLSYGRMNTGATMPPLSVLRPTTSTTTTKTVPPLIARVRPQIDNLNWDSSDDEEEKKEEVQEIQEVPEVQEEKKQEQKVQEVQEEEEVEEEEVEEEVQEEEEEEEEEENAIPRTPSVRSRFSSGEHYLMSPDVDSSFAEEEQEERTDKAIHKRSESVKVSVTQRMFASESVSITVKPRSKKQITIAEEFEAIHEALAISIVVEKKRTRKVSATVTMPPRRVRPVPTLTVIPPRPQPLTHISQPTSSKSYVREEKETRKMAQGFGTKEIFLHKQLERRVEHGHASVKQQCPPSIMNYMHIECSIHPLVKKRAEKEFHEKFVKNLAEKEKDQLLVHSVSRFLHKEQIPETSKGNTHLEDGCSSPSISVKEVVPAVDDDDFNIQKSDEDTYSMEDNLEVESILPEPPVETIGVFASFTAARPRRIVNNEKVDEDFDKEEEYESSVIIATSTRESEQLTCNIPTLENTNIFANFARPAEEKEIIQEPTSLKLAVRGDYEESRFGEEEISTSVRFMAPRRPPGWTTVVIRRWDFIRCSKSFLRTTTLNLRPYDPPFAVIESNYAKQIKSNKLYIDRGRFWKPKSPEQETISHSIGIEPEREQVEGTVIAPSRTFVILNTVPPSMAEISLEFIEERDEESFAVTRYSRREHRVTSKTIKEVQFVDDWGKFVNIATKGSSRLCKRDVQMQIAGILTQLHPGGLCVARAVKLMDAVIKFIYSNGRVTEGLPMVICKPLARIRIEATPECSQMEDAPAIVRKPVERWWRERYTAKPLGERTGKTLDEVLEQCTHFSDVWLKSDIHFHDLQVNKIWLAAQFMTGILEYEIYLVLSCRQLYALGCVLQHLHWHNVGFLHPSFYPSAPVQELIQRAFLKDALFKNIGENEFPKWYNHIHEMTCSPTEMILRWFDEFATDQISDEEYKRKYFHLGTPVSQSNEMWRMVLDTQRKLEKKHFGTESFVSDSRATFVAVKANRFKSFERFSNDVEVQKYWELWVELDETARMEEMPVAIEKYLVMDLCFFRFSREAIRNMSIYKELEMNLVTPPYAVTRHTMVWNEKFRQKHSSWSANALETTKSDKASDKDTQQETKPRKSNTDDMDVDDAMMCDENDDSEDVEEDEEDIQKTSTEEQPSVIQQAIFVETTSSPNSSSDDSEEPLTKRPRY